MNRFFKWSDNKTDKFLIDLDPISWWSRVYEYCSVLDKTKLLEGKRVLDAGSGVFHPFRFKLAEEGYDTYSCDLQDIDYSSLEEIMQSYNYNLSKELFDKVRHTSCNLIATPYADDFFNVIICISVLEHIEKKDLLKILKEFNRILKSNGSLLLTMDYPDIVPNDILKMSIDNGFIVDGDIDYSIDDNCIHCETMFFGRDIKCFNLNLIKK